MIDYLIETKINGLKIDLIHSKASERFYVQYGLQKRVYASFKAALDEYNSCLEHATKGL